MGVLGLWASLGGCDDQANREYLGEALAVLHGEVNTDRSSSVETDIVILWDRRDGWLTDQIMGHAVNAGQGPPLRRCCRCP